MRVKKTPVARLLDIRKRMKSIELVERMRFYRSLAMGSAEALFRLISVRCRVSSGNE
jgi:hypothetical protein